MRKVGYEKNIENIERVGWIKDKQEVKVMRSFFFSFCRAME